MNKLLRDIFVAASAVAIGLLVYELFLRQWIGRLRMSLTNRG